MQRWSGGALALALMLSWIGVGHAFSLGPDRIDAAEAPAEVRIELEERAAASAPESQPEPQALQLTPVPEPSTIVQLSLGLGGLTLLGSRVRPRG